MPLPPPVTRTLPSGSSVAVCDSRAAVIVPAAVHTPAGLSFDIEGVEAEAFAPVPSPEVAGDDALAHPLAASRKVAAATVEANRCAVLFS